MKISTLVDYLAPIAFVGTLLATRDFQLATWVLVGACAVALAVGWITERRIAPVPLFSGVLALIFGGLTLAFHDPRFIKMKMTIVDVSLAIALFSGLALKKNPLKAMMGEAVVLPDFAWRNLTIRYAIFFLACAGVNEAVWRTQTDETWGVWRLVALGAAVLFSFAQAPYLMKHMQQPGEAKTPEPPDAGF
jgi:intracellular septation protein